MAKRLRRPSMVIFQPANSATAIVDGGLGGALAGGAGVSPCASASSAGGAFFFGAASVSLPSAGGAGGVSSSWATAVPPSRKTSDDKSVNDTAPRTPVRALINDTFRTNCWLLY